MMLSKEQINNLDKKNKQFYNFLIDNDFEIVRYKETYDDINWFIKDIDDFELKIYT